MAQSQAFGQSRPPLGEQDNTDPFRATAPAGLNPNPSPNPNPPFGSFVGGPFGANTAAGASSVIPGQRMLRMQQQQQQDAFGDNDQQQHHELEPIKKKKQNRKNITNGEIIMNQIDPSDKIDADTEITDYDDTLLEVLEMEPEITQTFIENLKNGEFIKISEKLIEQRMRQMQIEIEEQSSQESMKKELKKLIHEVIRILDRFIFFFQGLLGGMSMMHLVVIYFDNDEKSLLSTYSRNALKIDQVFHLMAFISCFGSFFQTLQIKMQSDSTQKASDRKFFLQSAFATACIIMHIKQYVIQVYTVTYIFCVINHPFIARISDRFPNLELNSPEFNTSYADLESQFNLWKIFQIIITIVQNH